MNEKLLKGLVRATTRTKTALDGHGKAETAKYVANSKRNTLSALQEIGKSGDLETIIAAEKSIIAYELKEYANSKSMVSSLSAAAIDLKTIEDSIELLKHPEQYKGVCISLQQPKNRDLRDLPLDGGRQAFISHDVRLGNNNKSTLDDHEKANIAARQQNLRLAEKMYIERQANALGKTLHVKPKESKKSANPEKTKAPKKPDNEQEHGR